MLVGQSHSQEDAILFDIISAAYAYLQIVAVLHHTTSPLMLEAKPSIHHPAILHEVASCGLHAHLET